MERFQIKPLSEGDFRRGYPEVIAQLSDLENVTEIKFWNLCHYLSCTVYHDIYVIIDSKNRKVVGAGTILVEPKFSHGCSYLAHLEDIVIDKKYRKLGLGSMMLNHLINEAMKRRCYKVRLISKPEAEGFYGRHGFTCDQQGFSLCL